MFHLLSEENRVWLVNLQDDISSEYGRVRSLSKKEWDQVKNLIAAYQLPCALSALTYSFGMLVYNHGHVSGNPPKQVLAITYSQLPSTEPGPEFQGLALDCLEPIINSKNNRQILRHYGIEIHKNLTHYIY